MTQCIVYTQHRYVWQFYRRILMLQQLFIDGRFYDPAYRERTWLRSLRRLWRRKK